MGLWRWLTRDQLALIQNECSLSTQMNGRRKPPIDAEALTASSISWAFFSTFSLCFLLFIHSTLFISDGPMPEFMEEPCTHVLLADMCIKVTFPNQLEDVLVLTRMGETSSIYEGFLKEDNDVRVVMIDTPTTRSRLVSIDLKQTCWYKIIRYVCFIIG